VFPGFGVGGPQVRFASLANHLGPGVAHTVVSLSGDLACAEKLDPGLDVQFPLVGTVPKRLPDAVLFARRFLQQARPRMVVTGNWGAIEWLIGARLAGLPHLHAEDGFGPEERERQIPRRVITRRLALRGADVVLPSRTLERIAREQWRLAPRGLHYVPNGIDLARFASGQPMVLPPGEGPVIGTIAALRAEKNLGRLLRAVAQVIARRPLRLVIVGDGPERPGLEALAGELGIAGSTTFVGQSAEPERWLASFDAFALSSDTEQMPISLLEAMAAGLPVIGTDVGDVRTMLALENAPFVTASDDATFARGLEALLDADWRAIGAANQTKATREYGEAEMFERWARLLGV
jgi:glycosyltransferase involved in cell wall biosynthesis